MKHRAVSFIVLVFFRVFLVPAWFSWHIDNVNMRKLACKENIVQFPQASNVCPSDEYPPGTQNPGETYEQVRLKKRRSSFLEENIYIYELTHSRATLFTPEQRTVFFTPEPAYVFLPAPNTDSLSSLVFSNIVLPLYLWNRMLRI